MKKWFLCLLCFCFVYANDDIVIDEHYFNQMLYSLIFGASCDEKVAHQHSAFSPNTITVYNGSSIDGLKYDENSKQSKIIRFAGNFLVGGIKENANFISADRAISYALQNDTLSVKSVCDKQSFSILHFKNGDFNIKLGTNPTKELAIVINANSSMQKYNAALKEIAPFIAQNIFKDGQNYAKISLVFFSGLDSTELGTFYDEQSFTKALNKVKGRDAQTRMLNLSLIKAMSNFTKDNGLTKEIYLISNAEPSDMQNSQKVLTLTSNLNQNIVKNSKNKAQNLVKIHTFAIGADLKYLKDLAQATNGTYHKASNAYDFKKQILTTSNDGKDFDMRKIDKEIRINKAHKAYDPDNPDE